VPAVTRPPWPELPGPLRRRLLAGDVEFAEHVRRVASALGPRVYNRDTLRRAVSYPFPSLGFPFVMVGRAPWPLVAWDGGAARDCRVLHRGVVVSLEAVAVAMTWSAAPRLPLISYGSNASLEGLARKLRAADGEERVTPVVTGSLADYDVGPSAHLSSYGAMPATLFASAGVVSRMAVTWVTGTQLAALATTEVNYRLGWLDRVRFSPDIDSPPLTGVFAFLSRHGVFGSGSEPFRLEAVNATGRTSPALSQREVLDEAARALLGEHASAPDVVRRATEDYVWAVTDGVSRLRARATTKRDPNWHALA